MAMMVARRLRLRLRRRVRLLGRARARVVVVLMVMVLLRVVREEVVVLEVPAMVITPPTVTSLVVVMEVEKDKEQEKELMTQHRRQQFPNPQHPIQRINQRQHPQHPSRVHVHRTVPPATSTPVTVVSIDAPWDKSAASTVTLMPLGRAIPGPVGVATSAVGMVGLRRGFRMIGTSAVWGSRMRWPITGGWGAMLGGAALRCFKKKEEERGRESRAAAAGAADGYIIIRRWIGQEMIDKVVFM
mmetsp:Transcript_33782/g.73211  ORF Transcript_33782/g.73211 Transcript_33782/m.73211 type:complete len:243 (+) Transcript_33782:1269-1997(+)